MEFDAKFQGLDQLLSDIRSMGDGAEKELITALDATAQEGERIIKQATPAGPNARGAWSITKPDKFTRIIGTESKVNWFLEWGTGSFSLAPDSKHAPYEILPGILTGKSDKKFLMFQGKGGRITQAIHPDGSKVFDEKGRAKYHSKAGYLTINKKNAANMVFSKYGVIHPGIKPVGMVRGNLPRIRELFERNVQAASDRMVEKFLRGF